MGASSYVSYHPPAYIVLVHILMSPRLAREKVSGCKYLLALKLLIFHLPTKSCGCVYHQKGRAMEVICQKDSNTERTVPSGHFCNQSM